MVVTAGHGVRMQYDYTGDIAGPAGAVSAASPRWLRLTRAGDTLTGYESADGAVWHVVGAVHLAGLRATVQAGMLAASPVSSSATSGSVGGQSGSGALTPGHRPLRPRQPRGAAAWRRMGRRRHRRRDTW